MLNQLLISVIMPCNRPGDLPRAIEVYLSQDWQNKELVIISNWDKAVALSASVVRNNENIRCFIPETPASVGLSRNMGCEMSEGGIITHFDSDDWYATDYLSRAYAHLIESKADCTGLSSAYFYRPKNDLWLYEYQGNQPYCIGSGLMYYRRVWENNPFKDLSEGEDAKFCANAGRVKPHNYIEGFMAMIHGKNTASHKQLAHMKRVDPQIAKRILGEDWEKY